MTRGQLPQTAGSLGLNGGGAAAAVPLHCIHPSANQTILTLHQATVTLHNHRNALISNYDTSSVMLHLYWQNGYKPGWQTNIIAITNTTSHWRAETKTHQRPTQHIIRYVGDNQQSLKMTSFYPSPSMLSWSPGPRTGINTWTIIIDYSDQLVNENYPRMPS